MKGYKFKGSCFVFCFAIGFSLLAIPAWSADFCVNTAADLQSALAIAQSNGEDDIIRVQQGTYYGNFTFNSSEAFDLTILGGHNHPRCKRRVVDPGNTILDAGGSGRVLTFDCSGVSADLVVDGLTIQNGNITGNGVGVLVMTNQGNALLKNNVIRNNSGGGTGGGVYFYGNETVNLINNLIEGNRGGSGGGIVICEVNSVNMTRNTVSENNGTSGGLAGGVSIGEVYGKPALVTFINNVVSSNTTEWDNGGLAIDGYNATITVDHNTIKNNSARDEAGGKILGGGPLGRVIFTNNIVSYNFGIEGPGGIVIADDQEVSVKNNFIIGNTAGSRWGFGGINLSGAIAITLSNNIISNNSGTNAPGGVHIDFPSDSPESVLTMTDNTIFQNTSADYGGGIKIDLENEAQSANVYNNIIFGNNAVLGSDLYIENDGNNNGIPSLVKIFNNDFDRTNGFFIQIDDNSVVYSDNLDNVNPLFVDPANADFHLTSSSPCIDAGMDAGVYVDFDGDIRPQGLRFDIGADEYVGASGSRDLDIARFSTSNRVSLSRNKNTVEITLAVVNNGSVDEVCPATVVGAHNSDEVYRQTIEVSDQPGNGPSDFSFPPYEPLTGGEIVWTVTVDDGDPDVDEAVANTTVVP